MKAEAILYTSETGHTARYAKMLGEKTGLPVYTLEEAMSGLPKGTQVIYLGWLLAARVKDYKKAAKRFAVRMVCAVGLCTTGALLPEVRKANKIPTGIPVFTVQGGMDHDRLPKLYKRMIDSLIKFMAAKKNKTPDDMEMLRLLQEGGDYVCEENLSAVLKEIAE